MAEHLKAPGDDVGGLVERAMVAANGLGSPTAGMFPTADLIRELAAALLSERAGRLEAERERDLQSRRADSFNDQLVNALSALVVAKGALREIDTVAQVLNDATSPIIGAIKATARTALASLEEQSPAGPPATTGYFQVLDRPAAISGLEEAGNILAGDEGERS